MDHKWINPWYRRLLFSSQRINDAYITPTNAASFHGVQWDVLTKRPFYVRIYLKMCKDSSSKKYNRKRSREAAELCKNFAVYMETQFIECHKKRTLSIKCILWFNNALPMLVIYVRQKTTSCRLFVIGLAVRATQHCLYTCFRHPNCKLFEQHRNCKNKYEC